MLEGVLSRRELLERLVLLSVSLFGCSQGNLFDRERVCVHVYRPGEFLPEPLLGASGEPPSTSRRRSPFTVGLPELVVCSGARPILGLFEYFWPITNEEFQRFRSAVRIDWVAVVVDETVVGGLRKQLAGAVRVEQAKSARTIVILTLNTNTQHWASTITSVCRDAGVDELVIIKDPTVPPYLCDHPTLQKGFRRPPP